MKKNDTNDNEEESEGTTYYIDQNVFKFFRDFSRPRGLLSSTDREFLAGEKDYKHEQSAANRRQDIRERVAHGLQDFVPLWWLIDERDLVKIFDNLHDEGILNDSLSAVISFIYRGLGRDENRLEQVIERGVYAADNLGESGQWAGGTESVAVTIDIERNPDVDAIHERLKQGDTAQLTPTEIGILVRAGKIKPDTLADLEEERPVLPGIHSNEEFGSSIRDESEEDQSAK